jgi:hypothetical protein
LTTGLRELSRTEREGGRSKGRIQVTTEMTEFSKTGTARRRARRG